MPTVTEIISMRQRRRSRQERNPGGRFGLGCSLLISLLAASALIGSALIYTQLVRDLPSLDALPTLLNPVDGQLLQPTRILDRTGQHSLLILQDPAAQGSQYLLLPFPESTTNQELQNNPPKASETRADLFPAGLIAATIASVEPGFWSGPGFSMIGMTMGSHPTIAQRIVSDLLLWDEPAGLRRNLRERLLAAQITARFGKTQILEWYLNSAAYGHLVFGADAAARVYFAKPASELNLAESAWLAAIAQSPLSLPDAAQQESVIQAMLNQGLIDSRQADQALNFQPAFQERAAAAANPAPAFTRYVLSELDKTIDSSRLERGGLQIITSLDYELQIQVSCTVNAQLTRLGSRPIGSVGELDCPAARLLPTLAFVSGLNPQNLAANAAVLDPRTGEILALVGEPVFGLDPTVGSGRLPGTMLTPSIYLTAFTRGLNPASLLWDIPATGDQPPFQNFDGRYHGPLRLRSAFANDYVVPAAQLFERLGPENVLRTSRQLGLSSLEVESENNGPGNLQIGEVTLLELTRSFGIFANQGSLSGRADTLPSRSLLARNRETENSSGQSTSDLVPIATLRMETTDGQIWLDWHTSQSRPVITPQLAYLTTNVLSDEAARWSSLGHPNALEIGRPAAAKLGRAISGADTWTVGYTPQLVTGVWVGSPEFNQPSEVSRTSPDPSIAAAIWHAIMQYAHLNLPSEGWSQPVGITTVEVCDPSGMLPSADCPSIVSELFLAGSEPTQSDNLYQSIQINRETGRLATVFTPAALVVEHVFMIVPPEAQEWAENAGIEVPPETYDVVANPDNPSPNARIDSPVMFAHISNQVMISGSAGGDNFAYYRVQVGQGLNPQSWLQVGGDVASPIEAGALTTWDTTDLSGLYAVQLLVVRADQRVDSDVIQVTIDNQSPEVSILYPADGQELPDGQITFQANASDNLNLIEVSFFIDNRLVGSLTQAPFAYVWQSTIGTHKLRLEAVDLAGNSTSTEIQFSIVR